MADLDRIVEKYFDTIIPIPSPEIDEQSEIEQLKNTLKKFSVFHTRLDQRYDSRSGFIAYFADCDR
ncbi:hypothetical protein [Sodalis sp. dw_96]|uniref:hypothetical protein n=1 Tax=Sodalis sp. dw_96 TaxID=2719794 RepID=UPI001BD672B9|nr:hypothetical protein [Sodalis sp. dw_96]